MPQLRSALFEKLWADPSLPTLAPVPTDPTNASCVSDGLVIGLSVGLVVAIFVAASITFVVIFCASYSFRTGGYEAEINLDNAKQDYTAEENKFLEQLKPTNPNTPKKYNYQRCWTWCNLALPIDAQRQSWHDTIHWWKKLVATILPLVASFVIIFVQDSGCRVYVPLLLTQCIVFFQGLMTMVDEKMRCDSKLLLLDSDVETNEKKEFMRNVFREIYEENKTNCCLWGCAVIGRKHNLDEHRREYLRAKDTFIQQIGLISAAMVGLLAASITDPTSKLYAIASVSFVFGIVNILMTTLIELAGDGSK